LDRNAGTQYSNKGAALQCFAVSDYNGHRFVPMMILGLDSIMNQEVLLQVKCTVNGKRLEGHNLCKKVEYLELVEGTIHPAWTAH